MAESQPASPLARRLIPPHEQLRDAETHVSGRRAAVFNSALVLCDAKYLLLESQRTDGSWAGTPMWFAAVNDTIFLRTQAHAAKLRRMSRTPIVKVTPCTMRGKPLDDYIECAARIAPEEQEAQAEAALDRGSGPLRRLINRFTDSHHVYLELTPLDRESLLVADGSPRLEVRTLRGHRAGPDRSPPDAA